MLVTSETVFNLYLNRIVTSQPFNRNILNKKTNVSFRKQNIQLT